MSDLLLNIGLVVVALIVVAFTSLCAYIHYIHVSYDHIPGPKRTSFFWGNWPEYEREMKVKGKFATGILHEWTVKYGKTWVLFFFHKARIITVDLDAIKDLLVTGGHHKPQTEMRDVQILYGARFMGLGLVTETNHEKWSESRTLMNPAFNRKSMKSLMPDFNQLADILMDALSPKADGKTKISMLNYLNRVSLEAISKVAFGMEIDAINSDGANNPFKMAIEKILEGFEKVVEEPSSSINPFSQRKLKKEVNEASELLRKIGQDKLEERLEMKEKGQGLPDDILTHILLTGDPRSAKGMELMLDHFVTLFIAGQETTANSLAFALMEIGRHPEVMAKLRHEIDTVVGHKSELTFEDLSKMDYTAMVMKETLRMYPPVASSTVRFANKDMVISGYSVPKGTLFLLSAYVSGRWAEYHPDPHKFDPERFGKDAKIKPSMYSTFPFSLGPRMCIGQLFAQIESKVILAKFFQRFNMALDMTQSFGIVEASTIRAEGRAMCTLTMRSEE